MVKSISFQKGEGDKLIISLNNDKVKFSISSDVFSTEEFEIDEVEDIVDCLGQMVVQAKKYAG